MPLLQGTLTYTERKTITGVSIVSGAYFKAHATVAGRYVLADRASEAGAYLKASAIASALGRLLFDTVTSDRPAYLVTSTRVIA